MVERRSLGDAMNMSPEKLSFIRGSTAKQGVPQSTKEPEAAEKTVELKSEAPSQEERPSTTRRRSRGRSSSDEPLASEVLDQVLVPVTIRLPHRTAQALKRAHLEQKLKYLKPDTLQGIGEEALADWLTKAGYLD
jgi:hypothetical protein